MAKLPKTAIYVSVRGSNSVTWPCLERPTYLLMNITWSTYSTSHAAA